MSGACRLPAGGRVDRARPLRFTFDGRSYTGLAGDTLASALLANGVHLVGRSFKYHRPRGILTAGCEEPNALVQLDRGGARERAQPARHPARAVRRPRRDEPEPLALAELRLGRRPPTGWRRCSRPASTTRRSCGRAGWWRRVYEPTIRARRGPRPQPGAARSRPLPAPPRPLRRARGRRRPRRARWPRLAAAMAGAPRDSRRRAGRAGRRAAGRAERPPRRHGRRGLAGRRARPSSPRMPNLTLLPRTTAFAWLRPQSSGPARARHRPSGRAATRDLPRAAPLAGPRAAGRARHRARSRRPLVFPGNDRPAMMLAAAARTYLTAWRPASAAASWSFTNNDPPGERRSTSPRPGSRRRRSSTARGRDARTGRSARRGDRALDRPPRHRHAGAAAGRRRCVARSRRAVGAPRAVVLRCAARLAAAGPRRASFSQAAGALRWDESARGLPARAGRAARSPGRGAGCFALAARSPTAARPGPRRPALGRAAATAPPSPARPKRHRGARAGAPDRDGCRRPGAFVDLQNDVTVKDLRLALREGCAAIEHVKRYTTTGMAPIRARLGNVNGARIVADGAGVPRAEVRGRPPSAPPIPRSAFGALAGASRTALDPLRRTPIARPGRGPGRGVRGRGAVAARRATSRSRARTWPAAVARECRAAREAVGLFDASTLGKIDVEGPTRPSFSNRVYTNAWARLGRRAAAATA
ncbi:MAG: hypothetical protein KatS3mg118_1970 [Paracoccaceae bacterium]|nr:MAG: hypothetical protein KatS3mg118_1970 [Paracoccaceae bacterium]